MKAGAADRSKLRSSGSPKLRYAWAVVRLPNPGNAAEDSGLPSRESRSLGGGVSIAVGFRNFDSADLDWVNHPIGNEER